ncbi:MAG TPA: radical SAM protein [Bryobacteraceae bacterium]|nr:radical SAM protein [Bryobacteraceae bacterium]
MGRELPIFRSDSRSILSSTSGFIAEAGFTHSLTPARNCTYGCVYCYVPTLHVYGGLKREDWERWGQFTTFKSNAADLLRRQLRATQRIYCSPLVDPYQPAEASESMMPGILEVVAAFPPAVFAIQTRGPLIERDLPLLEKLARVTRVRVSFSLTTNDDRIRAFYEPYCESVERRIATIRRLRDAGIEVYATLAPLLPCDPEALASAAIEATAGDLIGDPLHVRAVKASGATTRAQAQRIAEKHGHTQWFEPAFQNTIVERIRRVAASRGRQFGIGTEGFAWLART